MIYHKQKQLRLFFERKTPTLQLQSCRSNSRRFPTTFSHDLRTQDLDAWRIGRTEVVGRQEQGTGRGKTTQWPPCGKNPKLEFDLVIHQKKTRRLKECQQSQEVSQCFWFCYCCIFFKDLLWYIKDHQISIGYWSAPCNMFLIFFCCCWKPFLKPLPETNPFSHLKVGGWNTIVSSWDGGLFSGANLLWVLGSVTSSADWIWWSISWTNPSLRSVRNWMNSSSQDSMIEFLSVQFLSLQVHHTWILRFKTTW